MSVVEHKSCRRHKRSFWSIPLTVILSVMLIVPPGFAQNAVGQPISTTVIPPNVNFIPALLKGMTIDQNNPLRFDFIIDGGNANVDEDQIRQESDNLVQYFLASMTVPQGDFWVNLSPYESDRIISESLGKTALGKELLGQDYILKQLTASLLNPETELGAQFWNQIKEKALKLYGTSDVPMDIFNKVWILPESATVYENGRTVYIVESRLKVMLESDYLAMNQKSSDQNPNAMTTMAENIVRNVILPEINREVNEGKSFAPLRQVYSSLILAKWYKETIKSSLLSRVYIDQRKLNGIELPDQSFKDKIYHQYLGAFEKGAFNSVQEEYDDSKQEIVPRKYFSGGIADVEIPLKRTDLAMVTKEVEGRDHYRLTVSIEPQSPQSFWARWRTNDPISKRVTAAFLSSSLLLSGPIVVTLTCALGGCGGGGGGGVNQNQIMTEVTTNLDLLTSPEPAFVLGSLAYQNIVNLGVAYPSIVTPVLRARLEDPTANTNTRKWSARLIGQIGLFNEAFPLLLSVFVDANNIYEDSHVEQAQEGLRLLFERNSVQVAINHLTHANENVRLAAVHALGNMQNVAAVNPLIAVLQNDSNATIRAAAVDALVSIGDLQAVAPLIQAAQNFNEDSLVRIQAALGLGILGDVSAVTPLGIILSTDAAHPDVREAVAFALGSLGSIIGGEGAINFLEQSLLTDAEWFVRQEAALALGRIDNPVAVPTLIQALQNDVYPDGSVKVAAALALGMIADVGSANALVSAMKNDSIPLVRAASAFALGEFGHTLLGNTVVVTALSERLTSDVDNFVKENAAIALGKIGDEAGVPALSTVLLDTSANNDVRVEAATALGLIGSVNGIAPLSSALLDDPYWLVRYHSAVSLGQIGDKTALPALQTAVATDKNPSVVAAAQQAIDLILGNGAGVKQMTGSEARRLIESKLNPAYHHLITREHLAQAAVAGPNFNVVLSGAGHWEYKDGWERTAQLYRIDELTLGLNVDPAFETWVEDSSASIEIKPISVDPAMKSQPVDDQVGGIDLNQIELNRRGSGIEIQFDPKIFELLPGVDINGFAPSIINLTPIKNIMPLLGLESSIH